jgi:acylglycerol lipase
MKVVKWLLYALALAVMAFGSAAAFRVVPPYVPGKRAGPPPSEGAKYSEHRLDVGGLKLLRRSLAPVGSAPARGTLVIVHGLKDYSDRYQDFALYLVKRGFRVETFDLRGHGDSEGDRVRIESFDEYLADLDKVMAEVKASNPGPLFLFGHSMGGAISTRWAQTRKPELAGLVLSAAALKIDAPAPLVSVTKFLGSTLPRAAVFELDDTQFSRSPGMAEAMKKDPLIYDAAAPARTAAELIANVEKLRAESKSLTVPLLALHGTADKVTPPSGTEELLKAAGSTDKQGKLYPTLVHDLLHEPEAATVMADIAAWMEERAPVAAPPEPEPKDPE